MDAQNPNFAQKVHDVFAQAAFIADVGISLRDVGAGWCETTLDVLPKHLQHDGFVHAGVQATMAEHTASGAALSLVKEDEAVLSVAFQVNLLRPATGSRLHCTATVLKAGKNIVVVESEVFTLAETHEKLSAKATVTLVVINQQGH